MSQHVNLSTPEGGGGGIMRGHEHTCQALYRPAWTLTCALVLLLNVGIRDSACTTLLGKSVGTRKQLDRSCSLSAIRDSSKALLCG
jgi:hypothetical protein